MSDVIARYFPDRFLVRGGCFRDIRGASPRFLETPLLESEYTYVGDIDIIILEGDVTEQHVAHMAQTGLPYSNRLRPNTPRLTGLHFTRTDAHYPLVVPSDWNMMKNDEELLYRLVRAKGLPLPAATDTFRPSHGIHLSVKRTPTRAPGAGPHWPTTPDWVNAHLALWEKAPWQEAAEHFHPAYRALLLVLEATLQAQDPTRVIYRRQEAVALWAKLAIEGVVPVAAATLTSAASSKAMASTTKRSDPTRDAATEPTQGDAAKSVVSWKWAASLNQSTAPDVVLYVVGGDSPDASRNPAQRDFPVLKRKKGEKKMAHLERVRSAVEQAMAAGGTHLLVPSEFAEWLNDHPGVAEYFAKHHQVVDARAETVIVFALYP